MIPSDCELLIRFREHRDRDAFGEIVRRYGSTVLGVCRRVLGDPHRAEDAFQQTFMQLATHASSVRQPEALAGWLYSAARRAAMAHIPKARMATYSADPIDQNCDPLQEISAREWIRIIEEEVAELPTDYRSAIVLCGMNSQSIDDASVQLASTPGAVRGWLQRGREMLKERLQSRGIQLPASLTALVGLPAVVSASTTEKTIQTALSATHVTSGIGTKLVSILTSKTGTSLLVSVVILLLAWRFYQSLPLPQLPPLEVASWELSAEASLPKGAIARIGDYRHTLQLGSKAIRFLDSDRKIVAVGKSEFLAWEVATGKRLYQKPIPDGEVAISPEGSWLVVNGEIFDCATGQLFWHAIPEAKPFEVYFVAENLVVFTTHPVGKREFQIRLLDVSRKQVQTWDIAAYRARVLPGGTRAIAWDRPEDDYDGNLLDDPQIRSFRVMHRDPTDKKPATLSSYRGEPLATGSDSQGRRWFAVVPEGKLMVWDTESGELLYQADANIPPPNNTRYMSDNRQLKYFSRKELDLLFVFPDGDRAIWSGWIESGKLSNVCHSVSGKKVLWQDTNITRSAYARFCFHSEMNQLFINDHRIAIVDPDTGKLLNPEYSFYANRGPVGLSHQFDVSSTGRLVAFSNHTIGLYDVNSLMDSKAKPVESPELNWQSNGINEMGFLPQSNDIVWGGNSNLSLFSANDGKLLHQTPYAATEGIRLHSVDPPTWKAIDRYNLMIKTIVWDGAELKSESVPMAKQMKSVFGNLRDLQLHIAYQDSVYVAQIEPGKDPRTTITRWDPFRAQQDWSVTMDAPKEFVPNHTSTFDGLSYHPDYLPRTMFVSPDGLSLYVLSNTRLSIHDLATGRIKSNISSGWTKKTPIEFDNLCMSADGRTIAISLLQNRMERQHIRAYSVDELQKPLFEFDLGKPNSHRSPGPNVSLALSNNGLYLAVKSSHLGLNVYDLKTKRISHRLESVDTAYGFTFSPDASRLIARESNGRTALILNLSEFAVK